MVSVKKVIFCNEEPSKTVHKGTDISICIFYFTVNLVKKVKFRGVKYSKKSRTYLPLEKKTTKNHKRKKK